MGLDVNGPNNIPNVNMVSGTNTVQNKKLLDCVYNKGSVIPNTYFNAEEQHTLGILANHQDFILIEE